MIIKNRDVDNKGKYFLHTWKQLHTWNHSSSGRMHKSSKSPKQKNPYIEKGGRQELSSSMRTKWSLKATVNDRVVSLLKSVAFSMGTMLQWTIIHSRVQIDVMDCCFEMKTQSWMDVEEGIDLRGVMGGGMNMIKIYYMKS